MPSEVEYVYDLGMSPASSNAPKLTVAACQMEAIDDAAANLATIERLARSARERGARLAVFPEAAAFPIHASGPELEAFATRSDELRSELAAIAARVGVGLVAGLFEPCDVAAKVFNTVVAIDADGGELGRYRKIHLYDAFGTSESERFVAGDIETLAFSIDGVTFGVLTCYDLRFPEMARLLVDAGADALIVPAAWARGPLKEDHWSVLIRARAIESTAYVVAAGQCGSRCTGLSTIVDPLGVALAGLGEEEGVAVAELRRDRIADVRERLPVLANRRLSVRGGAASPTA
jgi:predicted amidohydrolase